MSLIVGNQKELPADFVKAVSDLEVLSEARAFVFIYKGSIDDIIIKRIRGLRDELSNIKKLILIVDSGGGSIDAAHRFLQFLREDGRKLDVYVPDYAKSAATFLCLGADNIIMHKNAELGPLDPQIKDPKGRRRISVLDRSKSIDYLRNHAIQTFDMMTNLILKRTDDFTVKDAIEVAQNFAANICEPLYGKVDPDKLGEYARLIKIGEEYTRRAMMRYGYKDNPSVEEIIGRIIYGYPSHSFIIDYREAHDLGLNVRYPSKEEEKIMDRISTFIDKIQCVGILGKPVTHESLDKEVKSDGKDIVEEISRQ